MKKKERNHKHDTTLSFGFIHFEGLSICVLLYCFPASKCTNARTHAKLCSFSTHSSFLPSFIPSLFFLSRLLLFSLSFPPSLAWLGLCSQLTRKRQWQIHILTLTHKTSLYLQTTPFRVCSVNHNHSSATNVNKRILGELTKKTEKGKRKNNGRPMTTEAGPEPRGINRKKIEQQRNKWRRKKYWKKEGFAKWMRINVTYLTDWDFCLRAMCLGGGEERERDSTDQKPMGSEGCNTDRSIRNEKMKNEEERVHGSKSLSATLKVATTECSAKAGMKVWSRTTTRWTKETTTNDQRNKLKKDKQCKEGFLFVVRVQEYTARLPNGKEEERKGGQVMEGKARQDGQQSRVCD